MSRGRVIQMYVFPEPVRPEPTYPEYAGLRAMAEESVRLDGGFVDPAKLRMAQGLGGGPWQICVLGHDRSRPTVLEMHMLLLARGQDLRPPEPQWYVDALADGRRRRAERAAEEKARDDRYQAVWDEARKDCQVEVEVWRNGHARPHHGYNHHLGHVVPRVDARSGDSRRHRAGRALCESERRAMPLDLSGGQGGPATCVSCLSYTPKIRPAAV